MQNSNLKVMLIPVEASSREYLHKILPVINNSYRWGKSKSQYKYSNPCVVQNITLQKQYQEKKEELKKNGYKEKDLRNSYTFLYVKTQKDVETISSSGINVGNLSSCCLGDATKGVQLCRHADIIQPSFDDIDSGFLVIFKVIKGHVKHVECDPNTTLEPTPQHDCHITSVATDTTPLDANALYQSSQLYMYECGREGFVDHPRQVLPFAVVQFSYSSIRLQKSFSSNSEPSQQPLSSVLPTSTACPPLNVQTMEEGSVVWNGPLTIKGLYACYVDMKSSAKGFTPVKLGEGINITHKLDASKVKQKYLKHIGKLRKYKEEFWGHYYVNVCELHPSKPEGKGHFEKMMNYLGRHDCVAVQKIEKDIILLLLTQGELASQLDLTRNKDQPAVMYCLFLSKLSRKGSGCSTENAIVIDAQLPVIATTTKTVTKLSTNKTVTEGLVKSEPSCTVSAPKTIDPPLSCGSTKVTVHEPILTTASTVNSQRNEVPSCTPRGSPVKGNETRMPLFESPMINAVLNKEVEESPKLDKISSEIPPDILTLPPDLPCSVGQNTGKMVTSSAQKYGTTYENYVTVEITNNDKSPVKICSGRATPVSYISPATPGTPCLDEHNVMHYYTTKVKISPDTLKEQAFVSPSKRILMLNSRDPNNNSGPCYRSGQNIYPVSNSLLYSQISPTQLCNKLAVTHNENAKSASYTLDHLSLRPTDPKNVDTSSWPQTIKDQSDAVYSRSQASSTSLTSKETPIVPSCSSSATSEITSKETISGQDQHSRCGLDLRKQAQSPVCLERPTVGQSPVKAQSLSKDNSELSENLQSSISTSENSSCLPLDLSNNSNLSLKDGDIDNCRHETSVEGICCKCNKAQTQPFVSPLRSTTSLGLHSIQSYLPTDADNDEISQGEKIRKKNDEELCQFPDNTEFSVGQSNSPLKFCSSTSTIKQSYSPLKSLIDIANSSIPSTATNVKSPSRQHYLTLKQQNNMSSTIDQSNSPLKFNRSGPTKLTNSEPNDSANQIQPISTQVHICLSTGTISTKPSIIPACASETDPQLQTSSRTCTLSARSPKIREKSPSGQKSTSETNSISRKSPRAKNDSPSMVRTTSTWVPSSCTETLQQTTQISKENSPQLPNRTLANTSTTFRQKRQRSPACQRSPKQSQKVSTASSGPKSSSGPSPRPLTDSPAPQSILGTPSIYQYAYQSALSMPSTPLQTIPPYHYSQISPMYYEPPSMYYARMSTPIGYAGYPGMAQNVQQLPIYGHYQHINRPFLGIGPYGDSRQPVYQPYNFGPDLPFSLPCSPVLSQSPMGVRTPSSSPAVTQIQRIQTSAPQPTTTVSGASKSCVENLSKKLDEVDSIGIRSSSRNVDTENAKTKEFEKPVNQNHLIPLTIGQSNSPLRFKFSTANTGFTSPVKLEVCKPLVPYTHDENSSEGNSTLQSSESLEGNVTNSNLVSFQSVAEHFVRSEEAVVERQDMLTKNNGNDDIQQNEETVDETDILPLDEFNHPLDEIQENGPESVNVINEVSSDVVVEVKTSLDETMAEAKEQSPVDLEIDNLLEGLKGSDENQDIKNHAPPPESTMIEDQFDTGFMPLQPKSCKLQTDKLKNDFILQEKTHDIQIMLIKSPRGTIKGCDTIKMGNIDFSDELDIKQEPVDKTIDSIIQFLDFEEKKDENDKDKHLLTEETSKGHKNDAESKSEKSVKSLSNRDVEAMKKLFHTTLENSPKGKYAKRSKGKISSTEEADQGSKGVNIGLIPKKAGMKHHLSESSSDELVVNKKMKLDEKVENIPKGKAVPSMDIVLPSDGSDMECVEEDPKSGMYSTNSPSPIRIVKTVTGYRVERTPTSEKSEGKKEKPNFGTKLAFEKELTTENASLDSAVNCLNDKAEEKNSKNEVNENLKEKELSKTKADGNRKDKPTEKVSAIPVKLKEKQIDSAKLSFPIQKNTKLDKVSKKDLKEKLPDLKEKVKERRSDSKEKEKRSDSKEKAKRSDLKDKEKRSDSKEKAKRSDSKDKEKKTDLKEKEKRSGSKDKERYDPKEKAKISDSKEKEKNDSKEKQKGYDSKERGKQLDSKEKAKKSDTKEEKKTESKDKERVSKEKEKRPDSKERKYSKSNEKNSDRKKEEQSLGLEKKIESKDKLSKLPIRTDANKKSTISKNDKNKSKKSSQPEKKKPIDFSQPTAWDNFMKSYDLKPLANRKRRDSEQSSCKDSRKRKESESDSDARSRTGSPSSKRNINSSKHDSSPSKGSKQAKTQKPEAHDLGFAKRKELAFKIPKLSSRGKDDRKSNDRWKDKSNRDKTYDKRRSDYDSDSSQKSDKSYRRKDRNSEERIDWDKISQKRLERDKVRTDRKSKERSERSSKERSVDDVDTNKNVEKSNREKAMNTKNTADDVMKFIKSSVLDKVEQKKEDVCGLTPSNVDTQSDTPVDSADDNMLDLLDLEGNFHVIDEVGTDSECGKNSSPVNISEDFAADLNGALPVYGSNTKHLVPESKKDTKSKNNDKSDILDNVAKKLDPVVLGANESGGNVQSRDLNDNLVNQQRQSQWVGPSSGNLSSLTSAAISGKPVVVVDPFGYDELDEPFTPTVKRTVEEIEKNRQMRITLKNDAPIQQKKNFGYSQVELIKTCLHGKLKELEVLNLQQCSLQKSVFLTLHKLNISANVERTVGEDEPSKMELDQEEMEGKGEIIPGLGDLHQLDGGLPKPNVNLLKEKSGDSLSSEADRGVPKKTFISLIRGPDANKDKPKVEPKDTKEKSKKGPIRSTASKSHRQDRQHHPYARKEKTYKKGWSFNIDCTLEELMQNLTTRLYKDSHFTVTPRSSRPRFANYRFRRSAIPEFLPDEREDNDLTADAIPDFDERRERAELLDAMTATQDEDEPFNVEQTIYDRDAEDEESRESKKTQTPPSDRENSVIYISDNNSPRDTICISDNDCKNIWEMKVQDFIGKCQQPTVKKNKKRRNRRFRNRNKFRN